jgi:hypothetical protein
MWGDVYTEGAHVGLNIKVSITFLFLPKLNGMIISVTIFSLNIDVQL